MAALYHMFGRDRDSAHIFWFLVHADLIGGKLFEPSGNLNSVCGPPSRYCARHTGTQHTLEHTKEELGAETQRT